MAKLQTLIDRTAKHGAAFHKAQDELLEFCRDKYGVEPGDVDADEIIDAVLGGCGAPSGMDAAEFDRVMHEHMPADLGARGASDG